MRPVSLPAATARPGSGRTAALDAKIAPGTKVAFAVLPPPPASVWSPVFPGDSGVDATDQSGWSKMKKAVFKLAREDMQNNVDLCNPRALVGLQPIINRTLFATSLPNYKPGYKVEHPVNTVLLLGSPGVGKTQVVTAGATLGATPDP